MKNIKIIILVVLCTIALVRLITPIAQNWHLFTERFDPKIYEKKYNASQYMIPQSKNPISDETLLSYAGYKYMKGTNPILINSDHPPLGKYIIGFFTLLTGNNRVVSVFFAIVNITLLCSIIYLITHSLLLGSIGFLILSFDPMLIDQVIHSPILDIIQISFLLLYLLLFICWQEDEKRNMTIIMMAIALGCLSSIKLYFPAIVVMGVTVCTMILLKKHFFLILKYLIVTGPIAFFTYAATYFRYFLEVHAFFPFFGVQKWIFLFWQNNSINNGKVFGNVIPFLLFNKWHVWWGTEPYISYSGWSIMWPIFFILGLLVSAFFIVRYIFSRKNNDPNTGIMLFLSLWFAIFTSYLLFIPISPRYLMMLYFPTYIQVVVFIYYQFAFNKRAKKLHK